MKLQTICNRPCRDTKWVRRVMATSAAASLVLMGGLSTTAYATAGPRSNGDVTYYLNGQATTVDYQTVQVSFPCGGWYAEIVGGPYTYSSNNYGTGYQPYCLSYSPAYFDNTVTSTSYSYSITGSGGDNGGASGSVTFYVS